MTYLLSLNILLLLSLPGYQTRSDFFVPINSPDRKSVESLSLTDIGAFGIPRKPRPQVAAHFHTGIDIKRPHKNYQNEPVFPVAEGIVISKRDDGPFAQLIVEHKAGTEKFWTVYEHIAGIRVRLNEIVKPDSPMARFMNKAELDKNGWQFDHFHFEVLKVAPIKIKIDPSKPDRHFSSYTLVCHKKEDLEKYFHHPVEFLKSRLRQ